MLKGVLAVVASSVAYGLLPVFSKIVLSSGLPSGCLVFFRFFFACLAVAVIMKVKKISFRISRYQFTHLLFFGIIGFGMTAFLLTQSYNYVPIGLATMFHFTYPLFVTIVMILLYKEEKTLFKILSMAAAVGGLVLMADFSGGLSVAGVLFAASSGVTYAVYVIATRKSAFSTLPIFTIIFYVTLFSSILFGTQSLVSGTFRMPASPLVWLAIITISLLCTVFALCLLTMGIQILRPVTASVLNMIEPVTSLVAGFLIFHDRLSVKSMAGCGCIILSALFISMDARRLARAAAARTAEEEAREENHRPPAAASAGGGGDGR